MKRFICYYVYVKTKIIYEEVHKIFTIITDNFRSDKIDDYYYWLSWLLENQSMQSL